MKMIYVKEEIRTEIIDYLAMNFPIHKILRYQNHSVEKFYNTKYNFKE